MIFETKEVFNELVSERYDEILELSKKIILITQCFKGKNIREKNVMILILIFF